MSRGVYRWELRSALTFPFAMACVEGNVIGVIAQKAFEAPGLAVAALSAAPPMAHITSFLWARVLAGRHRARATMSLQLAVAACVAGIAAAPTSASGLGMLLALTLLSRVFIAGLVTARSDVWEANYPRAVRASAVGKITTLTSLVISVSALAVGLAMDASAERAELGFRVMYGAAALAGVAGAWFFSHVRWRRGAASVREERHLATLPADHASRPAGMVAILKRDRDYRRFLAAQFTLGVSAMAAMAPFIIALDERMNLGYGWSIALTQAIPLVMPLVAIPFWARLLDRMHIARFRATHAWSFILANAMTALGVLTQSLTTLILARMVLGIGYGGGRLAWNIGHHDFAPRRHATVYMGVHVTLTGVRGAFAPFLGAVLYTGWDVTIAGAAWRWGGLGGWLFLALAGLGVAGATMFALLDRDLRRRDDSADDEQAHTDSAADDGRWRPEATGAQAR